MRTTTTKQPTKMINKKQQTAVDFYRTGILQLNVSLVNGKINADEWYYLEADLFEQAKEMENIEQAKEVENQKLKDMYLKGIANYDPTNGGGKK
jgi:hypothetical protein